MRVMCQWEDWKCLAPRCSFDLLPPTGPLILVGPFARHASSTYGDTAMQCKFAVCPGPVVVSCAVQRVAFVGATPCGLFPSGSSVCRMVILSSNTIPGWGSLTGGTDRSVEHDNGAPTFHTSVIHSRTRLPPPSSQRNICMATTVANCLDMECDIMLILLHNCPRHNQPSNVQVLM